MNSVVEKLAAIEKEVAAIQPKMTPLTERIADLHQKVTDFTQQLADLAAESIAVKQDVELTRQGLSKIQSLISESKVESEQLVAGQEENQQRCETMTAVFGAAFQAVSQFFETAQRMGLADQAKAVFLPPVSVPAALPQSIEPPAVAQIAPVEAVVPFVLPDVPPSETFSETTAEAVPEELPVETALPVEKPSIEEPSIPEPPIIESAVAEPPAAEPIVEPIVEPILSDADFDAVMPGANTSNLDPLPIPSLPDVAAPPTMEQPDFDAEDSGTEVEPSQEIESQLDIPPLNLAVPALPEQSELPADNADDQDIEAMLASMMVPVTAAAGN